MKERNLFKEALDAWGADHQIDLLIEEMSELTKSLLKLRRYGNDKAKVDGLYDHVCEEVGDVEIVLQQMKLIFPEEIIEHHKEMKLKRLEGHLEEFYLHRDDYNIELTEENYSGILETFKKLGYRFRVETQNYRDILLNIKFALDDGDKYCYFSINNYTREIFFFTRLKNNES